MGDSGLVTPLLPGTQIASTTRFRGNEFCTGVAGVSLALVRESGLQECWRVSRFGRWGTGLAFGGFSAVALVDTVAQGRTWFEGLGVAAVLIPLWLIFAVRPSLCLTGQELVVRNPLWTHRIPLPEVAEARPGYFGITIKRYGRLLPVMAWAVQETNTAGALDVETRAKRAASRIMEAARPSP